MTTSTSSHPAPTCQGSGLVTAPAEGPGRRGVLVGGAAACAGVGLGLAGCSSQTEPSTTGPVDSRESVAPDGVLTAGLAEGENLPFETPDGDPGVLVRLDDGSYVAYSAICTHQGCSVAAGEGPMLECPCHGSVFDASAGAEPVSGPARAPLPEIAVEVGSDGVRLA